MIQSTPDAKTNGILPKSWIEEFEADDEGIPVADPKTRATGSKPVASLCALLKSCAKKAESGALGFDPGPIPNRRP